MNPKLVELLSKYLLIPLLTKGAAALKTWAVNKWAQYKEKRRQKKAKKVNKVKVENYENADNTDDANDSFGELP